VRNDLLGEIDGHEGHILVAVQVPLPGCNHGLGAGLDEIVHDGQVMRRQVPKNVDVVLEEP
jgi:hypothetical protein